MAYEKNPDEIGVLWTGTSAKGPYLTGEINGVKVVCFPVEKRSDKSPSWRVLKSKPREQTPSRDDEPPMPESDVPF